MVTSPAFFLSLIFLISIPTSPAKASVNRNYVNHTERNVHVWSSLTNANSEICIVGGIFARPKQVSVKSFYTWLGVFIFKDHETQRHVQYVLVPLHVDVKNACFRDSSQTVATRQTTFYNILRAYPSSYPKNWLFPSDEDLPLGDYALYRWPNNEVAWKTIPEAFLPILAEVKLNHRTRSRSPSASASAPEGTSVLTMNQASTRNPPNRKEKTRKEVRIRDLRCRVTGDEAPLRGRGRNFKGLEVAHIFPIGWLSEADAILRGNPGLATIKNSDADAPDNALLLRADLHAYFDDYQFGFYGKQRQVIIFERNGAPYLQKMPVGHSLLSPLPLLRLEADLAGRHDVKDILDSLLDHHFNTCLLWHVRGLGRTSG